MATRVQGTAKNLEWDRSKQKRRSSMGKPVATTNPSTALPKRKMMTPGWGIGRLAFLLSTAVMAQAAGPLGFEVAPSKPTAPMGRGNFK